MPTASRETIIKHCSYGKQYAIGKELSVDDLMKYEKGITVWYNNQLWMLDPIKYKKCFKLRRRNYYRKDNGEYGFENKPKKIIFPLHESLKLYEAIKLKKSEEYTPYLPKEILSQYLDKFPNASTCINYFTNNNRVCPYLRITPNDGSKHFIIVYYGHSEIFKIYEDTIEGKHVGHIGDFKTIEEIIPYIKG